MKRFFNFSITANCVLALFAFLFADYSAANCQTAITATVPFQSNALATGTFRIFLKTAGGNTAQLTRPIIIVEGIDFFEQFPALATTEIDVINRLNEDESHFLASRRSPNIFLIPCKSTYYNQIHAPSREGGTSC